MVSSSWILVFALGILSASADHHEGEDSGEPSMKGKVQCRLDLGLVIDQTKSIGYKNLPEMREGVKEFVKRFIIGSEDSHVSLSTFANLSTLHSKFSDQAYHSEKAVLDLIDSSLTKLSSPTRLDRALKGADGTMFTLESGDRPGFRSAMMIVTDGKTNPETEDFMLTVNSLKAKGVQIVAIAFGPKSTQAEHQENLRKIAGDSVYDIADYPNLEALFDNVTKDLCPDVCAVDLALVADKTRSIGFDNFQLLRGFLLQISDSMDISPATTHEAVITFANTSTLLNRLDDTQFQSNQAMHMLIDSGIDNNLGSPTRTDRALEKVEWLFTYGGNRTSFRNSMLILTDGKTNPASTPFSQIVPNLKALKIRLIAVGIGKKVFKDQLNEIAGGHVHLADDFDDLSNLFKILMEEICSVDGGFSSWSPYGACSVSCGSGTQQRSRTCTNPHPHGTYGLDCVGSTVETKQCDMSPCNMSPQDSTI